MEQSRCEKFLANPRKNPDTGGVLQFGKVPYIKLVEECGIPPIDKERWETLNMQQNIVPMKTISPKVTVPQVLPKITMPQVLPKITMPQVLPKITSPKVITPQIPPKQMILKKSPPLMPIIEHIAIPKIPNIPQNPNTIISSSREVPKIPLPTSKAKIAYLENLPYDIFYNMIMDGGLRGKDLINICNTSIKLNKYCIEDIFKQLLDLEYGLKNITNPKQIYNNLSNVDWLPKFNKSKATILLINLLYSDYKTIMEIQQLIENTYPDFRSYLRRGDIIQDIYHAGYNDDGIYFYDGTNIIEPLYEILGYGIIPDQFIVFEEFAPDYWYFNEDDPLNINTIYVPQQPKIT